ncbi:10098_t:CDS:2, partial [Entrophospora sp. SA101]
MPVGFCPFAKYKKLTLSGERIDRYKRKPEDVTYKMRKPIEMEANITRPS